MPTTITIQETAKPALRRLNLAVQSTNVAREIGRAVVQLVRDNFHTLPLNEHNFPTTHFWQRAADATRYDLTAEGVEVSVNQIAIRQRLLGGRIVPKRRRFLTIPAIAETYGHVPADFGPLKIVRSESPYQTTLALAPKDTPTDKSGHVDPHSVFFWLLRSATQSPNPKVLPTNEEITTAAVSAAANALK